MNDKPIIMSAESVQAILAGNKTQTRRVVALPDNFGLEFTHVKNVSANPNIAPLFEFSADAITNKQFYDGALTEFYIRCPYQIGQKLWLREKFSFDMNSGFSHGGFSSMSYTLGYADGTEKEIIWEGKGDDKDLYIEFFDRQQHEWCSPVAMPRWASRLTLEVVGIRCERLQDITEKDAVAEGITERYIAKGGAFTRVSKILHEHGEVGTLRNGYAVEWTNLNAKRGYPWDSNPWVWVIEFKVVK